MGERWKWAPGYEGLYLVSDLGHVMSAPHECGGRSYAGVELSPSRCANGYMRVFLSRDGAVRNVLVHRLVAEAFIPFHAEGVEVNHINGNKEDNRLVNLEWVTHGENVAHAWRNLPRRAHDRHIGRKLDAETARRIRAATGTYAQIGSEFGITPTMVGYIKNGKRWRIEDVD
uniref:HNH endonuclease n=1 Tax=uncultured bacterium Contig1770 TaxID=1393510 RepID=W0FHQ0_9BACT|nr:HNH endonuclease [uncultured bacterium Contig1770]